MDLDNKGSFTDWPRPSQNLGPSLSSPGEKIRRKKIASKKNPNRSSIFDFEFSKNTVYGSKLINPSKCVHKIESNEFGAALETKKEAVVSKVSGKFRCSVCGGNFQDVLDQRAHFKTDWHIFNLKRKILSKEAIDETTYLRKGLHVDSSDSENEQPEENEETELIENMNPAHNSKVHFVTSDNRIFSVYRSILQSSKDFCKNCLLYENSLRLVSNEKCWIILMFSGGHFAAAVFHKNEVSEHKAIHRYTVRAKRGTTQSVRDSKQSGRSPRSAGATIRRQNEAALVLDIQELLRNWKHHIDHADKVFIKWPHNVKSILFAGKSPIFEKNDVRLRKIPFMTEKPTFGEVKRIHKELSTVRLQDILERSTRQQSESEEEEQQDELLESIRTELSFNEHQ